jgi:hypothetical protein
VVVTNVDPNQPLEIEVSLVGIMPKSAAGESLTPPNGGWIAEASRCYKLPPSPGASPGWETGVVR